MTLSARFVRWIVGVTDSALDALGIGGVSLELAPGERTVFLVVSALPLLILIALLYQLGFEIDNRSDSFSPPFAETEWRLHQAARTVSSTLPFVTASILVFHTIRPISRGLGTWCFVTAVSLGLFAVLLTVYGGAVYAFVDRNPFGFDDWHPDVALSAAEAFGIIAVGNAFLAFRGLAKDEGSLADPAGVT